jgi:hypothetical protein
VGLSVAQGEDPGVAGAVQPKLPGAGGDEGGRSSWKIVRSRNESVPGSEEPIQMRNPSKSWIMVRGWSMTAGRLREMSSRRLAAL